MIAGRRQLIETRRRSVQERDLNVLDLFSGIGGFSLGLERAGMRTVAFCEIDPFCRSVLRHHWPRVPIYPDVSTLTATRLVADGIGKIHVICGGFPCQDISTARHSDAPGLNGERSGLWFEMFRLVREFRPDWVLVENVSRLRTLGADRILSDLDSEDYTARPLVVGAGDAGAPHPRARVWIVANSNRIELRKQSGWRGRPSRSETIQPAKNDVVTNRDSEPSCSVDAEVARSPGVHGTGFEIWERQAGSIQSHTLANGLPHELDAGIKAFGNAVLPVIPELIGRSIMNIA
jgi:DNA (cytosine-5)-methyltransferase 1